MAGAPDVCGPPLSSSPSSLLTVGVILAQMRDGRPVGGGGGSSSKREMTVGVRDVDHRDAVGVRGGVPGRARSAAMSRSTTKWMASQDVRDMQIQNAVASLIIGVGEHKVVVRQPLRTSSAVTDVVGRYGRRRAVTDVVSRYGRRRS